MKARFGFLVVLGGLLVTLVLLLVPITVLSPLGRPWSSLAFFFIVGLLAVVASRSDFDLNR